MRSRLVRALCQLACIAALSVGVGMLPDVSLVAANGSGAAVSSTAGTPAPRPGPPGTPTRQPAPDPAPAAPAQAAPGTPAASPVKPRPVQPAAGTPVADVPTSQALPYRGTPTPQAASRATVLRQPAPLAVVLNGRDQQTEFTVEIAVDNIAPDHAGWALDLRVDQFRTGGARVRALPAGAISLTGVDVACAADPCAVPGSGTGYPLAMPAGASRSIFVAAPGDGYGDLVITATFRMVIPANAYVGVYTGTADVTLSSGR